MSIFTATAKEGRRRDRKKKPDELLSSVVRETPIPAAVELMRANAPFALSNKSWAFLVLKAADIGGLSKRDSRNADKGSIIELIGSDQIATLATAVMLEQEVFGIIPTTETLSRMDEYSLLTGATYKWAVATQNEGVIKLDEFGEAPFAAALAVSQGKRSIREAISATSVDQAVPGADHARDTDQAPSSPASPPRRGLVDEPATDTGEAGQRVVEEAAKIIQAMPAVTDSGDELFDESSAPAASESQAPDFDEFSDVIPDAPADFEQADLSDADLLDDDDAHFDDFDDDNAFSDEEDGPFETAVEDLGETEDAVSADVEVADQDQVRNTLVRRFLSEDLDLSVGIEEFETIYGIGAPVVQIEVPSDSTQWLGDQVSQLVRQANAELAQAHQASEAQLRSEYVSLMGLHAEQVMRDVATDRDGSVYRELNLRAKADHDQKLEEKAEKARQIKAEIAADFEQSISRVGAQAASQAEIQYRERNKAKVAREQVDAVAGLDSEIEDLYSHAQQEILRLRRKDADRKMFVGQTRIFEVLSERQSENLQAERALLEAWTARIQQLIDEHRKDDIARTTVLAEEQSRHDQVAELSRAHEAKLEAIRVEHADRLRRMEDELERERQAIIDQMKIRDADWQRSVDQEKGRTDVQSTRVADLLAQMSQMGEAYKAQYDNRIVELESDKQSYSEELERASAMQRRSNNLITLVVVVLSLFMLAVGFIVGVNLG